MSSVITLLKSRSATLLVGLTVLAAATCASTHAQSPSPVTATVPTSTAPTAPVVVPAPVNDARAHALPVPTGGSWAWGRTTQSTVGWNDPRSSCAGEPDGTVWYRVGDPPSRELVLRLVAHGYLDAALVAYRFVNGKLRSVGCDYTGSGGVATIGFHAHRGDLVMVAQLGWRHPGRFRLLTLVPQPAEQPPGHPIHVGVSSTVERYLDAEDIWNVALEAGTTYRLRFASKDDRAVVVSPVTHQEVSSFYGNGYHLFTPGPSGGGRYLVYVTAGYYDGPSAYSFRIERAGLDDTGPGRLLPATGWVPGALDPRGIDLTDVYRFKLSQRSDILLALGRPRPKGVSLLLMSDNGKTIALGSAIRRPLRAGSYAVSVSARAGSPAVAYKLALRAHQASHLTASSKTATKGTPVLLVGILGRPAGGHATLEIDRLDPVQGWVYARDYDLRVRPGRIAMLSWLPAQVGRYRARITPGRAGADTSSSMSSTHVRQTRYRRAASA